MQSSTTIQPLKRLLFLFLQDGIAIERKNYFDNALHNFGAFPDEENDTVIYNQIVNDEFWGEFDYKFMLNEKILKETNNSINLIDQAVAELIYRNQPYDHYLETTLYKLDLIIEEAKKLDARYPNLSSLPEQVKQHIHRLYLNNKLNLATFDIADNQKEVIEIEVPPTVNTSSITTEDTFELIFSYLKGTDDNGLPLIHATEYERLKKLSVALIEKRAVEPIPAKFYPKVTQELLRYGYKLFAERTLGGKDILVAQFLIEAFPKFSKWENETLYKKLSQKPAYLPPYLPQVYRGG